MKMLQLTRFPDWPTRLAALVDARLRQTFAWGSHDCCAFAGDNVLQITGTDALGGLRGTWTSRTEALRLLHRLGGLQAAVTDVLGPPVAPQFARRGDLVALDTGVHNRGLRYVLAVCLGGQCVAPTHLGLRTFLPSEATLAWRVG